MSLRIGAGDEQGFDTFLWMSKTGEYLLIVHLSTRQILWSLETRDRDA